MSEEAQASNMKSTTLPKEETRRAKRKKKHPGNPDQTAEVIALSPSALMASDHYVCEQCNKLFSREQNLKLHMRCHLSFNTRDFNATREKRERKRAYICPVRGCIYNDPARALGDITGIKKHYGRKHGEKKWQCNQCLKKYAVELDWRAHVKNCTAPTHKCECGAMFIKKIALITHRSFCGVSTWRRNTQSAPAPMIAVESSLPTENNTAVSTLPTLQDLLLIPSTSIGHQPVEPHQEVTSIDSLLDFSVIEPPLQPPVPALTADTSLLVATSTPLSAVMGDKSMNGENGGMTNSQDHQAGIEMPELSNLGNAMEGDGLSEEMSKNLQEIDPFVPIEYFDDLIGLF